MLILLFNIQQFPQNFHKNKNILLSWKYVEIEVLEIRIDAHRQRRAKLSHSHSPRHLARFLTRNRTSIPRNSPRILAIFLLPYVPNRDEDKLLSTLRRNRDHESRPCSWNMKSKSSPLILFHLSRIHFRIENRQRSRFLCCAATPSSRDLLSFFGGLKNSKFTDDLAKNFRKLEIFESFAKAGSSRRMLTQC